MAKYQIVEEGTCPKSEYKDDRHVYITYDPDGYTDALQPMCKCRLMRIPIDQNWYSTEYIYVRKVD